MKELEWRFTGEWVDKLSEDFITEVLEVSEPKKNCWWSNMKAFADGNTSWKQRFHDVINNIRGFLSKLTDVSYFFGIV